MPRTERPSVWRCVAACTLAFVPLLSLPRHAAAAGPLIVSGSGAPLVWSGGAVPWNPDRGTLGTLSNAAAVALVADNFAKWQAVPTAALSIANAGALAVDVTSANVDSVLGVCGDGLSPIVFDTDGSITDALLGVGASNSVLGFAGPECGTFSPAVINEASAVLNGKFIDGIAGSGNPEISATSFGAVFLHEFGHYLNLDHSQINLVEAFDGNSGNDDTIATMFPFLVNGGQAASLARDDEVAISMLYPKAAFGSTRGRITGRMLRADGITPFQGAYVIARNVADPRHDAIGCASGARYFPANAGGPTDPALQGFFELPGLIPGASYIVEVEPIYGGFTGGSSVGPFGTPVTLPGPAERWNGANEAGSDPPDDPAAPGTPITAVAGATTSGIDIILNAIVPPPNDACGGAITIASFPFSAHANTAGATTADDDPIQLCTPAGTTSPNANSVWYRFTAPADGLVTVTTADSDYDTVLSAYTGGCGTTSPIACNDDTDGDTQSAIAFGVSAGTSYLLEVTDFGAPHGGALMVAATFAAGMPPSCAVSEPGSCIPGKGKPSTDCVTEWLAEPVPPVERATAVKRNVPAARLTCMDGDPSCDFDGALNGACTFHVAVCIGNDDPRAAVAGCVPAPIASYVVQQPSSAKPKTLADAGNAAALRNAVAALGTPAGSVVGGTVSFAPPAGGMGRCTTFQDLRVPVGTRILRTRATTATGAVDNDQLRLRCVRDPSTPRVRRPHAH